MLRHFHGRNQRSKSNKIKLGLQLLFLAAVCLWLMYQVKHSYYKKKEFDWTIKIVTDNTKLGRKDVKETQVDKTEVEKKKLEEGEDLNSGKKDEESGDSKNTSGALEIEKSSTYENEISSGDVINNGATFGDVTGLQTIFINQTMDTDEKTAVIEIQQEHKGHF